MVKALFLDRDGVINFERGEYTFMKKDFVFNPGIFELFEKFKSKGFVFIVISNQGGIAKKIYTKEQVDKLHIYMTDELKKRNIHIQEIFYCPHYNEIENCLCRKPESVMLEKAIAKYHIDVKNSLFIGDSERDKMAAEKVGLKAILITPNHIEDVENYV